MICVDKKGVPFELKHFTPEDHNALAEMYDCFSPKARFQGVPPVEKRACMAWIDNLIQSGENFVAVREDEIIGHVVVIPDAASADAEYLIFVSQQNRNRGIGTELTKAVLNRAAALGIKRIWLSVGTYNFIAIKLYRKFGFEFSSDDREEPERTMALPL
jgi:RimJ/RimL family protein N-acetyltransferase